MIKCLSYDFNGTSVDESGEDIGIIQVKYSFDLPLTDMH